MARESAALAFALSPCCFKGSLGKRVQRRGTAAGEDAYSVLVAVNRLVCCDDDPAARVSVVRDPEMGSPKNAFIVVTKSC